MQALIDFIIRNLMALWPVVRVDEWQMAMMVRNGRIRRLLNPGLHWRWWFIDRKVQWPRTEVVLTLPTASITTSDGHTIAVDGNIGYRLVDIALSWRSIWSMEASLKAAAQGILCSEIARLRWGDLAGDRRAMREAEIRDELNRFAEPRGLYIERLHLVACVEAKQHRHFVDGALSR